MSTKVMGNCWNLGGMSPAQKSVLVSLADQANDEGLCWPSVGTISRRTCLSDRAVQRAITWLEEAGALFRSERIGRSTYYTITPVRYTPPSESHPRQKVHKPPSEVHPTPEPLAPRTVIEPSKNRKSDSDGAKAKKKPASSEHFDLTWNEYPRRSGSNPRDKALTQWKKRVSEGCDPASIHQGVLRYKKHCEEGNKTMTEFVMQGARFFGKDKEFENDWAANNSTDTEFGHFI